MKHMKQPPEVFCKKGVLENFTKFTAKHLCQSLFFNNKVAILLKMRLWHRCFPGNFAKFLRTTFFKEHKDRLETYHNLITNTKCCTSTAARFCFIIYQFLFACFTHLFWVLDKNTPKKTPANPNPKLNPSSNLFRGDFFWGFVS